MPERCSSNSRHFSWLVKSCFPTPQDITQPITIATSPPVTTATVSTLPDDLLLECFSRVPSSSFPSLYLVCRRWSHLLVSPHLLSLRRLRHLLLPTLFTFSSSATNSTLLISSLPNLHGPWQVGPFLPFHVGMPLDISHSRLSAIGPRIYIVGRQEVLCYHTWSGTLTSRAPMISPTKRFATAVVSGKIYVAGGMQVEEYDTEKDEWRVVAHAPRRRHGCVGAAVDGVFYVIGGLKIGGASVGEVAHAAAAGAEAHIYASSMDLYDVEAGVWLRSRAVPGGGCVVAACAVAGHVYILASHAVELSFWRFAARRKGGGESGGGFGEWCRRKNPPLPAQVRLDSTVRFSCVGVDDKVALIQVTGCIDDLLRRSGRSTRGFREGLVLIYDTTVGEWSRGPDLPEVIQRAACASAEC